MPSRILPARPDLDHLREEAKQLNAAFDRGEADALARIRDVLGPRERLKLTEAQRVLAREYGFPNWAKLRAHVLAMRGSAEAIDAFLAVVANHDGDGARAVLAARPEIARVSLHVASALGSADDVRRLIAADAAQVHVRRGHPSGEPLLWLCYSPFHGESAERDAGLAESMHALLAAGADPNTRDERYRVPALYALTGVNNAPGAARILLDAGAEPTDGESVFHAAERYHLESLELLREYGVQLNVRGDWGNTPLYFLLRYHDIAKEPPVRQGFEWLLRHGADPNVVCGREQENSLHVAARRGQHPDVVRRLLELGADVEARTPEGHTAWMLARRAGFDKVAELLEAHGASPEPLSPLDELLAACGRGDADGSRRLASPALLAGLSEADLRTLPQAAAESRFDVALACVAAGFPASTADEIDATALHYAALRGRAGLVRALLRHGADFTLRDREHGATPLGWAMWGADHIADADGDYVESVRALLDAGARPDSSGHRPAHAGVRELIDSAAWP